MSLSKLQQSLFPVEERQPHKPRKTVRAMSTAQTLPKPKSATERDTCAEELFSNIREVCALIVEADRYGATHSMETEYRRLRTSLTASYYALARAIGHDAMPAGGFHGCGFEMILGNFSLEGLVRNSGVRATDRLGEVWRSFSGDPSIA